MENSKAYALITGPTSGIGYELAKLFAAEGYNLILVARHANELESTARELSQDGIQIICLAKDLFSPEAAFEIYDEVKQRNVQVDVLVNNAGQGLYGEFIETDIRRELDIIQLNTASLVALTKLFVQDMVARGSGKVLNLASIAGKIPGPWQSVYHATKAFVYSFSQAIRSELKDKGVVVTALLPGVTDTNFFHKADMEDSKVLQGDMADPAKVAKDGFDALMSNDDKVVSGLKNKAQVAMGTILPDSTVADYMNEQQAPVSKQDKA